MKSRTEELDLAVGTWKQAISRLQRKIGNARLKRADRSSYDEDRHPDSITAMERQITIYSLCVDWAVQQRASLAGIQDESRSEQRGRFYRLMAVSAKAEMDREDHPNSVAFVASGSVGHLSNQQALNELHTAASAALTQLVSGAALPHPVAPKLV